MVWCLWNYATVKFLEAEMLFNCQIGVQKLTKNSELCYFSFFSFYVGIIVELLEPHNLYLNTMTATTKHQT